MFDFSKFDKEINLEELNRQIDEAKNNTPTTVKKEVPDGAYAVKIEKMEIGATKVGNRPMFKVQCRIIEGEYKNWCIFMNKPIYGTKNDVRMISNVVGWLRQLKTETKPEFKSYTQFAECVLEMFEEVVDTLEFDILYERDTFNPINILEVYDSYFL